MDTPAPDPNNPTPTADNPNPEPAHPPPPPETPPSEPIGVPPPSPNPIPSPGDEPVQIPPASPPEVPSGLSHGGPSRFLNERTDAKARAHRGAIWATAALACIVETIGLAAAQSPNGAEEAAPSDPCQVKPEDRSENLTPDGSKEASRAPVTLEHCEGVLTPPKTGDEEIEEPPPDTGRIRIIQPDNMPEQPPN
jgi:hypothetical protein